MNKDALLKELNGFPKEFQPSREKQEQVLQTIMHYYDTTEKQNHKRISYKKWSSALVSVAAVLLAGFLLLPSILNQEQEKNQATESQMDKADTTIQKEPIVPQEKFHPNELENITQILISDHSGIRIKEISNQADLAEFTEKFKIATLYAKNNEERGNKLSDDKYVITINTDTDYFELEVWPNEKEGNVFETQTRKWWTVEGLDELMKNLVPFQLLSYDEIVQIAHSVYPDVNWEESDNSFIWVDKGNLQTTEDQVWKAIGITPSGEKLNIYIDKVTGDILKEEKPESTNAGVKAVQSFFNLVGSGDYEGAWDLIHSKSKIPTPGSAEEQMKQSFDKYYKEHQPKLKKIQEAQWNIFWKFPDCECQIENTIQITALLEDGQKIGIHAAKDKDNKWKLFWSEQGKLK